MSLRFRARFLLLLVVGCGAGCAGYRLGPTNHEIARSRTVQIVPFANKTLEPQLGDATTTALRKEIQRDGTFELVTSYTGDLIVTGTILHYDRVEISFLPTDVVTAQDFKVGMTAHVVARDRFSNRVVLERDFSGTTLIRVGNDLPSVERQSLPMLATSLARQITAALADGSW